MSEKRGCFKYTMFGCLGLLAISTLFVGGTALVAWKNLNDGAVEEEVRTTVAPRPDAPEIVKGIKAGVINWGIDQQPFLQAYLPVVILTSPENQARLDEIRRQARTLADPSDVDEELAYLMKALGN